MKLLQEQLMLFKSEKDDDDEKGSSDRSITIREKDNLHAVKQELEKLKTYNEELNKQVKEKDSPIAKMTGKVPEHTLVNELGEKDTVYDNTNDKVIEKLTNDIEDRVKEVFELEETASQLTDVLDDKEEDF
jgi:predicted RNase H-like nuclease (RuvC/YqgF family)